MANVEKNAEQETKRTRQIYKEKLDAKWGTVPKGYGSKCHLADCKQFN